MGSLEWYDCLMANGYGSQGAQYAIDPFGIVHLTGEIRRIGADNAIPEHNILFTLPEGFRPTQASIFTTSTGQNSTNLYTPPSGVLIRPDGTVCKCYVAPGELKGGALYLFGINFPALLPKVNL